MRRPVMAAVRGQAGEVRLRSSHGSGSDGLPTNKKHACQTHMRGTAVHPPASQPATYPKYASGLAAGAVAAVTLLVLVCDELIFILALATAERRMMRKGQLTFCFTHSLTAGNGAGQERAAASEPGSAHHANWQAEGNPLLSLGPMTAAAALCTRHHLESSRRPMLANHEYVDGIPVQPGMDAGLGSALKPHHSARVVSHRCVQVWNEWPAHLPLVTIIILARLHPSTRRPPHCGHT